MSAIKYSLKSKSAPSAEARLLSSRRMMRQYTLADVFALCGPFVK